MGGDAKKPAAGEGDQASSRPVRLSERAQPVCDPSLKQKLTQARATLLLRYPFFGYLVTNLEDKMASGLHTAGTDGQSVYWSEEFLQKLASRDVVFVMAHEALHCALQHLWRRGERDPRRWNIACDSVVNDMLLEAGLDSSLPMIRGANGRSAEDLYEHADELIRANVQRGLVDDHGAWVEVGKPGDPEWRGLSDAWRAALQQAKSFGNVPAGMVRHIDAVLDPKRDWRDLLREGLFSPEDYRWKPTDRRFPDVLLPTLAGEVHRVVIAIDTSGSIHGEKLKHFWTELVAILRNNRCEARVLTCDADIQDEWDEAQFDPTSVPVLRGGGGTNFAPVFDRVERYIATGWQPEALVYLTDLDGAFPQRPPEVRTLWVVGKDDAKKRVPFGEIIVLDF